jgi:effector-binding domain-containing protein
MGDREDVTGMTRLRKQGLRFVGAARLALVPLVVVGGGACSHPVKTAARTEAARSAFQREDEQPGPMLENVAPATLAHMSGTSGSDPAAITAAVEKALAEVRATLSARGIPTLAPPVSITVSFDATLYRFEAGVPVGGVPGDAGSASAASHVQFASTYSGPAVKVVHRGSWERLGEAYDRAQAFMDAQHLEWVGRHWEEYVVEPGQAPEDGLVTAISFPVKPAR